MRHRMSGRKLGRTSAHRKAMFRNQLTSLFAHERIVTTVEKAKELRPLAERMVTLARTGSLPARRRILAMVSDKDVVRRLFDEIAPRFSDRPGGYTRIMRLGRRRGDGAQLAIIEFIDYELKPKQESSSESGKTSLMDRAKGVFGGGRKTEPKAASTKEKEPEVGEQPAPKSSAKTAKTAKGPKTPKAGEPTPAPEPMAD
jgi:large subunit ribosomal protein L17